MVSRKNLERQLARDLGRCIRDFDLVGDRVMVCVVGDAASTDAPGSRPRRLPLAF